MSETVHYRGTLIAVERLDNETLEDQCKRLWGKDELDGFYDSYKDGLLDEDYEKYIENEGILYLVEKKEVGNDDTFIVTEGKDGILNFEVSYYNGGCSFDEAMGYAFENKK